MRRRGERGVSTVVGYVLIVGISSLLILGLVVATGGFIDAQRQETVRDEMEVLGQQLLGDLSAADRMVVAGGEDVTIQRQLPEEITGSRYRISIQPSGATTDIVLTTEQPDVQVTATVRTDTDVASSTLTGGTIRIRYDAGANELVIEND